jgi:hypothetical protein
MPIKKRRHEEQDETIAEQTDQPPGQWTQLELIDMDVAFCLRMRQAHPERKREGGRTRSSPKRTSWISASISAPIKGGSRGLAAPSSARRWR